MVMKIRADMILRQLEKRHTGGRNQEVFFTEVKNGPSWTSNNLLRLDAVAFKKSWTHPCITGYEVKVDRQDFLRDEKWPGYLQYCHRFSFACPTGLIAPDELPDGVGLIYYNQDKDCIITKRRASFRAIEIPWQMLYYLVISRIGTDRHPFFSDQREYLQAWVEDKADRRDLACKVSNKMVDQLRQAEKKANVLQNDMNLIKDKLDQIRLIEEILERHGVRTYGWALERDIEKALSNGIPPGLAECLERINQDVGRLMAAVKGA